LKYTDEKVVGSVDTTGEVLTVTEINGVANASAESLHVIKTGTNDNQRVGKSIILKKIQVQGFLTFPASTAESNVIKVSVVQDTQVNGSLPTYLDVYEDSGVNSWLNLENSRRFKILKTKYVIMNRMTAGPINFGQVIHQFKMVKKVNIPIDYNSAGTAGTIGELRSNGIFLMASASSGDDLVQYAFHTRVRYSDQ